MRSVIDRLKSAVIPEYRLAREKREFERYLRDQGWSKNAALAAVARKYGTKKR